jgi:hypothetical protein
MIAVSAGLDLAGRVGKDSRRRSKAVRNSRALYGVVTLPVSPPSENLKYTPS